MDCKQALPLMHEYLDGDLQGADALALKEHLIACPGCRKLYKQMETTDALVKSIPTAQLPDDLTDRIMTKLPPEKKRNSVVHWLRRHPGLSIAVVFVVVMLGSFLTLWDENKQVMVKGPESGQVIIDGNTVIVPEGVTVNGNLVVQGGELDVEGELDGNLTLIDGTLNLASTAHISGNVQRINESIGWLWYKVNEFFSSFTK
ncbi:zf-HC2 domain-containing protein [Paenibacillus larvae]